MRLDEEDERARELTLKIRHTRELIRAGTRPDPSIGDILYVPEDDRNLGGIATVQSISGESISVYQRPDVKYNPVQLMKSQRRLEAKYRYHWSGPKT
jgi:hypothetical protein